MKIYIYNQNCIQAGRSVPERIVEENPELCDWTLYEGSEDELLEEARSLILRASNAGAGDDLFFRRMATTILESLGLPEEKIDAEFQRSGPRFDRKQIAFIAELILTAAFDRIESSLPDTIPLKEFQEHRILLLSNINVIRDTAAMALAIIFAQTTGEGMGVYDWAGSIEFREAVDAFVESRTMPHYPKNLTGEDGIPDTKEFAEKFAEEWADIDR